MNPLRLARVAARTLTVAGLTLGLVVGNLPVIGLGLVGWGLSAALRS